MVSKTLVSFIDFYSYFISPALPPSCRFYPTCSQYARQAILHHGALRGGLKALQRLLKCHPFHPGGFDPVLLKTINSEKEQESLPLNRDFYRVKADDKDSLSSPRMEGLKTMKYIEEEGKSVEEAIQTALTKLKVERDDVSVEVIQKDSRKFFGLFGVTPAKVRLTLKQSQNKSHRAKNELEKILSLMGFNYNVISRERDGRIYLNIPGKDSALLIGRNGENLEALQHLVSRILAKKLNLKTPVIIDVGSYRQRQEKAIEQMALKVAQKVRKTGRASTIPAMNPHYRRIVHLTLQDLGDIKTTSKGVGFLRKVIISPSR